MFTSCQKRDSQLESDVCELLLTICEYRSKPESTSRERELLQRIITISQHDVSKLSAALSQAIHDADKFLSPTPTLCKHCGEPISRNQFMRHASESDADFRERIKDELKG
jgi:hypothetical protein